MKMEIQRLGFGRGSHFPSFPSLILVLSSSLFSSLPLFLSLPLSLHHILSYVSFGHFILSVRGDRRRTGLTYTGSAGISIGLIDDIPTCEVLVARIVQEAEMEINRMSGLLNVSGAEEAWDRSRLKRESKL